MIQIVARIKGPEDAVLVEKRGISLQAVPALVELLTPGETYLEITLEESSNSNKE